MDDAQLAKRLAQGTGDILKGVRDVGLLRGRELGDLADSVAQAWISRVLEVHRPADGMLSEEIADTGDRLSHDRVWIIDPLDGTNEFAGGGQDWAVHIALVENGVPVVAAVGLPDMGVVFHSDEVKAVTGPFAKRILMSHDRPPKVASYVCEQMGYERASMGSAGAKAMHVLLGDADAYIHAGGQYEWDSAAPVGVAKAAGLDCFRLDGSELTYNREDTYLPDLVICRPDLTETILKHCADYFAEHNNYGTPQTGREGRLITNN